MIEMVPWRMYSNSRRAGAGTGLGGLDEEVRVGAASQPVAHLVRFEVRSARIRPIWEAEIPSSHQLLGQQPV